MNKIFKDNPTLDVIYKTSDGKYFYLKNEAQKHADTLEKNKVQRLERNTVTNLKRQKK